MGPLPINRCRVCGATSYRRVVGRGAHGHMTQMTGCQCSGCSTVFADSRAWRGDELETVDPAAPPLTIAPETVATPHS